MATVKENLIAAKALIADPANWGKGKGSYPPEGCYCVVSALSDAIPIDPLDNSEFLRADRALSKALPERWRGRPSYAFNDAPETTHEDAIALYDRAIAAQEEVSA